MRAALVYAATSRMRIQYAVGFRGRVAPDAVYARFEGCSMSMKVRGVTICAMFGQTARAPRFGESTLGRRDARDAIVMISTRSSSVTTRIKRDAVFGVARRRGRATTTAARRARASGATSAPVAMDGEAALTCRQPCALPPSSSRRRRDGLGFPSPRPRSSREAPRERASSRRSLRRRSSWTCRRRNP